MSTPTARSSRFGILLAWPDALALLALAIVLAYRHTLDVPFTLDDFSSIQENALIYRWQGFGALMRFAPLRVLVYATFALNYRLGHFDPAGYHLVNLAIHFLAGAAVYAFARGLMRTPRLAGALSPTATLALPLVAALLFVIHPLQTQAVTYIVQRLASMVAMFYIAALACYLQARLAGSTRARVAWGTACAVLFLLALFSKENAATFPLAVLLIEATLFEHDRRSRLRVAAAAAGGLVLVWVIAALAFGGNPLSPGSLSALTSQSATIPRSAYLATQMPILWTYLRLFVWPAGLHLDYPSSPLRTFAEPRVWLALGGHVALIALAVRAGKRRPLIPFAVLFVYLAHGIESSVIPIPELAFEHRTYLPNLGLCLLGAWVLVGGLPRLRGGAPVAPPLIVALLVLLGVATWRRNQVWRDPVAFWLDNVDRAPGKARAWGSLGKAMIEANRLEEGEKALRESVRLQQENTGEVDPLDIVNLAMALQRLQRDDEALALIDRALAQPSEDLARAMLHLNRGNIEFEQRRFVEAEHSYREALRLRPNSLPAEANLASTMAQTGHFSEAESLYADVLRADPSDTATAENLARVRAMQSRRR